MSHGLFVRIPSGRRSRTVIDLAAYMMIMVGSALVVAHGAGQSGYGWQWYRAWRYLFVIPADGSFEPGLLLRGLGVTLQISALSLVLALLLAVVTVLLRGSGSRVGWLVSRFYVESIRNTPLLIQLFVTYFVVAPVLGIDRFAAAVVALAVFEGAYMAEILRAGIDSVPQGQWEASRSLGMDEPGTALMVIMPQALRRALPPLTGQAVSLVKDSSLVSAIAIHELTMEAQIIISETFLTFEIWMLTAAIYLTVSLLLSGAARYLERHLWFEL